MTEWANATQGPKSGIDRADDARSLEAALAYRFSDPGLLDMALTHASAKADRGAIDNERLEFLGDRVLGLVIAEALLVRFPAAHEGELAPRFNELVRKKTLADLAQSLGLPAAIRLAKGEIVEGSRARETILADACEAVIAAIYLDGGLAPARDFVLRSLKDHFERLRDVPRDAKTALQEWAQARGGPPPSYSIIARSGPDHAPRFTVRVVVQNVGTADGEGLSRRNAEQAAAQALLANESLLK